MNTTQLMALFVSAIIASLVTACSQNKTYIDGEQMAAALQSHTQQNGRACINIRDIRSYGFADPVITLNGPNRYYLATTTLRCHDASNSAKGRFSGPGNQVCGGGASQLNTGVSRRCIISHVFEFNHRSDAFAALNTVKEQLTAEPQ